MTPWPRNMHEMSNMELVSQLKVLRHELRFTTDQLLIVQKELLHRILDIVDEDVYKDGGGPNEG